MITSSVKTNEMYDQYVGICLGEQEHVPVSKKEFLEALNRLRKRISDNFKYGKFQSAVDIALNDGVYIKALGFSRHKIAFELYKRK